MYAKMYHSQKTVQKTQQKLVMTQDMYQSLDVLQMSLPDLSEYIRDQALSNPLVELEEQPFVPILALSEEISSREAMREAVKDRVDIRENDFFMSSGISKGQDTDRDADWIESFAQNTRCFREDLREQLWGLKGIDPQILAVCGYLIECLDERGYLALCIDEVAEDLGITPAAAGEALKVLQGLQPAGVGARDLSENLQIQLTVLGMWDSGYEMILHNALASVAEEDINAIIRLLGCDRKEAAERIRSIRGLNPYPVNGYADKEQVCFSIPEATLEEEDGHLILKMNRSFLPRILRNKEVTALLKQDGSPECMEYLKENEADAKKLVQFVDKRMGTVEQLLSLVVEHQAGYFLRGESLKAMTMMQAAQMLGVNVSTVSRTICGKTILWKGHLVPLRDLFARGISSAAGKAVSFDSIKEEIRRLVREENPQHPLSDKRICANLEARRITISRRTVAKYREEMGIPCAARRKNVGLAV